MGMMSKGVVAASSLHVVTTAPAPGATGSSGATGASGESDLADERRVHDRFEVTWAVDCVADDTFLFASLTNISEMGIFVQTEDPLIVGTSLWLSFTPPANVGGDPFKLEGVVAWINPLRSNGDNINPGMGVRFVGLTPENRERIVAVVRAIAYLR